MKALLLALPLALAAAAHGYSVETVAEGLEVPWSMDFAPDGRMFLTERGGQVRVIQDGQLLPDPVLRLGVGSGEGGLLGIALDPDFEQTRKVYLYYTYGLFAQNRVSSFVETGAGLSGEQVLLDGIPGHWVHDGGRIAFGPDGMLYVATGDAGNPDLSRDVSSLAGKILRIAPDGSVPPDNPFEGSPVYSYGHRNPQGLDWDADGRLVSTEHGPSGERGFAHDEINIIEAGADYGWPLAVGDESAEGAAGPALHTGSETWAPSGAAFYYGGIPEWDGMYMVAALAGRALVAVDPVSWTETGRYLHEYGRLRDAAMGPDGALYVLTSNRDGRGSPSEGDDRVLKISPDAHQNPAEAPRELAGDDRAKTSPDACSPGLDWVQRAAGGGACVRPETARLLAERGWAL